MKNWPKESLRIFPRFIAEWTEQPFFSGQRERNQAEYQRNQQIRLSSNPRGLTYALKYLGTGYQSSYWAQLDKLQMPTLFIAGNEDAKFCHLADEMVMRMSSKGCEVKKAIIVNSGHTTHIDQEQQFCELLHQFHHFKR